MSPANLLVEYELGAVDWGSLRAMGDAAVVPGAVRALVSAETSDAADAAYWHLDNNVVVQGQLFEAALPLVPVVLAALAGHLSAPARLRAMDLAVEIASGRPDVSETELGNTSLGRDCRAAFAEGLWLIYAQLSAEEASLRERAVQVVYAADPDRARVGTVLDEAAANDPDGGVRSAAAEFKRYMPGVVFDEA